MSSAAAEKAPTAVLETKLIVPPRRPGLVERAALVDRLVDAQAPVVVVTAPAGYGKTTVLVQYVEAYGRPALWVSLDATDDDPALLLLELATGIDRLSPVDRRLFRRLASAGPNVGSALPMLVNLLSAQEELLLVLDDLHLVRSPSSLDLISSLSERLPPGLRLVVASREAPPLPMGRLRAEGRLLELRQEDLALDRSETETLLARAGAELEADAVEALHERMEGWAAGVYLAALSLREANDSSGVAREFAGDDRDVVQYFSDEVLGREDDEHLSFLLGTSVLERFTAPLCDAVLRRKDSALVIDELERRNLFLVPLDRKRQWYRYHHLLAEMLRAELARRQPKLGRNVHRRAADWHRKYGTAAEAIEHAFAADEPLLAAELLSQNVVRLYSTGLQATLQRWLGEFSEEDAVAYPPLAILQAWAGGLLGQQDRARRYLALVEGVDYEGPLPLGESSLESAVAVLRASHGWDGVSKMRASAETAYGLEPPGSLPRARAAIFFGASLLLSGRRDEALGPLEEAALVGDAAANASIFALGLQGLIALENGRIGEAEDRLNEGLTLIEDLGLDDYILGGATHAGLACLSIARGDLEEARPFLERMASLIPRTASWPWWGIHLRVLAGRVAIAIGDLSLAGSLLEQARRELARYPDAGVLPRLLAKEERALEEARGGRGVLLEPLTEAEQRVLRLLPTHLTIEEIGSSLYISKNTVKGHLKAIYRKLAVRSRAEAVARARALGLDRDR